MFKNIVGYRDFHTDANFNFQLNRWLPFLPESELREAAAQIEDFDDWKRVMWQCAERAEQARRWSEAAFYYRAVEFFLLSSDPDKMRAYDKFRDYHDRAEWGLDYQRVEIPYASGSLPALVLEAQGEEVDTLVVHGGFDSFAEELIHQVGAVAARGFRVILFEGPGQGAPLKIHGMPMTPNWEKPLGVVLDHFGIQACTLMGISLGGCLATRAAAKEPRVKRVIADDVLEDFFGVLGHRMGEGKAKLLGKLLNLGARGLVNRALGKAISQDRVTAWAVDHGLHVSGANSSFEYLQWARSMNTRDISHELTQDYLLLGAREDHLIPLPQFYSQASTLTNVRSFTSRLFTAADHASSHCHIGNQPLVNRVITDWLAQMLDPQRSLVN